MTNTTHERGRNKDNPVRYDNATVRWTWDDRGRSLLSREQIAQESRYASLMHTAAMAGRLKEFLASQSS